MPRYKLTIEYKGTNYSGWQKQPDARTIEEEIEKAFDRVHDQHISMYGQGRTDGGVHAIGQTAHFDIPKPIDIDKLKHAFLGVLPSDIAVWDIREVEEDFHARFDAIYRQYIYRIARRPRPLFKSTSILAMYELDMARMRECAKWIEGEHNFDSFTRADNQNPSSFCNVFESRFSERNGLLCYHIRANRFVRHLVRRLVGTLLMVGRHKCTAEEFENLLLEPDKQKDAYGVPAKGLTLEKVGYEDC